jgi:hypothetical protein
MIEDSAIIAALHAPAHRATQPDGRIRLWVWIPSVGRWLRVVLLEDGETVHNAFFDRSFRP